MEPNIADTAVGWVRQCLRIALVPLCLYGLLLVWLVDEHGQHREHLEEILRSRASGVISTVEVGIANMGCKMRRQLPYLDALLKETVVTGSTDGIALYRDGKQVLKVGAGIEPDLSIANPGEWWTNEHLLVARRLRAGRCCQQESSSDADPPQETFLSSGAPHADHGAGNGEDDANGSGNVEADFPDSAARDPAGDLLVVAARRAPIQQELQQNSRHAIALGAVGLVLVMALSLWRIHKNRATRLQTELLLTEERLKLTRERSISAEGLAHETKNPLGMVRGMSQVLADDGLSSEEVKEYAERITEQVDRTVARINEFLKYARLSAPRPETVSLDSSFEKLKELISEGDQDLLSCDVDGGGLEIRADAELLRQVVFNLLTNAVEAVRARKEEEVGDYHGKITLQAQRTSDRRCSIVVEDNGSGIAPEDLPEIFNPYFSRRENGSGLGLAIVNDIGRSHGWTIEAESQPGQGSTFTVSNVEMA